MILQPLSVRISANRAASAPLPAVASYEELVALPSLEIPLPALACFVEAETGLVRVIKLMESTAETDATVGTYRPRDYSPDFPRVWFTAGT